MKTLSKKAARTATDASPVVFTVGHSTRSLEEFIALLKARSVASVVDVRTVPRSRHNSAPEVAALNLSSGPCICQL